MKFVLVFLAVACALATARFSYGPNVAPQNPVPIKPLQQVALPDHFDWRNEAHLTDIQNQRLPNWCGSCWAVAATSSISDRFRIHYKKQFGYRRLSSQAVLNCAYEHRMGSCTGGDWDRAHNFILQHGMPLIELVVLLRRAIPVFTYISPNDTYERLYLTSYSHLIHVSPSLQDLLTRLACLIREWIAPSTLTYV